MKQKEVAVEEEALDQVLNFGYWILDFGLILVAVLCYSATRFLRLCVSLVRARGIDESRAEIFD